MYDTKFKIYNMTNLKSILFSKTVWSSMYHFLAFVTNVMEEEGILYVSFYSLLFCIARWIKESGFYTLDMNSKSKPKNDSDIIMNWDDLFDKLGGQKVALLLITRKTILYDIFHGLEIKSRQDIEQWLVDNPHNGEILYYIGNKNCRTTLIEGMV